MKTYYERKNPETIKIDSANGFVVTDLGFMSNLELKDPFRYKEGLKVLEENRTHEAEIKKGGLCYTLTGSPTECIKLNGAKEDPQSVNVVAVIPMDLVELDSLLDERWFYICKQAGTVEIQKGEKYDEILLPDGKVFTVEHTSFTEEDDDGKLLQDALHYFGENFYNVFIEE